MAEKTTAWEVFGPERSMIFGHDTSRQVPELMLDLASIALGQTVFLLYHTHIIYNIRIEYLIWYDI